MAASGMILKPIIWWNYDGPEGSCYSTDFFCYANKIFVTQKTFFCYANKIFAKQKIFFLLRKKVFLQHVFFVSISKFFVSFIILICNPVFFATQVILLQFFFFSFYLIYLCYSIFFVSNVVFCFCLKHWKLSCYWFFYFLSLLYINFVFSFKFCFLIFASAFTHLPTCFLSRLKCCDVWWTFFPFSWNHVTTVNLNSLAYDFLLNLLRLTSIMTVSEMLVLFTTFVHISNLCFRLFQWHSNIRIYLFVHP